MELIKPIADYGILLVIAAIFIYQAITTNKTVVNAPAEIKHSTEAQGELMRTQSKALDALKATSDNNATALNIIQNTIASNTTILQNHDNRAEHMNTDVIKILECVRQYDDENITK